MPQNDTIISNQVALLTPVISGNLRMTKDKVDETSGQGFLREGLTPHKCLGASLPTCQVPSGCRFLWHSPRCSCTRAGSGSSCPQCSACASSVLKLPEGTTAPRF